MIRHLPPEFRSLYRLVLRTSSASVLHVRPATPRLRAIWRPTFDMAAQMTQKIQHPPRTEDEAKATAEAQDWLKKWGKQMDNTLSLLYTSAVSRGLAHKLTRNLHALSHHRREWLYSAYERHNPPWKPAGEPVRPIPKKRRAERFESAELAWNIVGEAVRMAEGRDQIMLGRAPPRQRKSYRDLE